MTGAGGPEQPPGFGPAGQVPTLHGEPFAAPRPGMPRGVLASFAFFGVLLVVAVAGLIVTRGGEVRQASDAVRDRVQRPGVSGPAFPTFRPGQPGTPTLPVTPPRGPVPKPVRYTGTGNKKITVRRPEPGETLVYVKGNAGGGLFFVFPLDKAGRQIGMLVNTREAYEGVRLLDTASILQTHALEVQARGAWTVELRSARSAKAFGRAASGRGDAVLRYEGPAGTATIRGGGPNALFLVTTRKNGLPAPVASGVGAFRGSKPWPAGPVLVEVQSSGPWSIRVS